MNRYVGMTLDGDDYRIDDTGGEPIAVDEQRDTELTLVHNGPHGRPVVLKRPKPDRVGTTEATLRVGREVAFAKVLGRRGGTRLPFVGAGTDPVPHVLTEYVPGRTSLYEHAKTNGYGALARPEWVEALLLVVGGQLRELADADIVHRDLKPANLLVATDSDGTAEVGGVWLIDLGHASPGRSLDMTSITATEAWVGTVGWMGPQQRGHGIPQPWWDVFNLGLVVAWAIRGFTWPALPLDREATDGDVRILIDVVRAGLPDPLAGIAARMLRGPLGRPEDALTPTALVDLLTRSRTGATRQATAPATASTRVTEERPEPDRLQRPNADPVRVVPILNESAEALDAARQRYFRLREEQERRIVADSRLPPAPPPPDERSTSWAWAVVAAVLAAILVGSWVFL